MLPEITSNKSKSANMAVDNGPYCLLNLGFGVCKPAEHRVICAEQVFSLGSFV
jgi:hypothetical protein